MARLSSDLILTLHDKVSGPARGIDGTLDRLERRQTGLAGAMARGGNATAKAAGMLGMYSAAAAPVAAGFIAKESITAAADFESALTNIQKKAGTTGEETAKLGREIRELATSGQLAVPIDEILGAYERGAAAGIAIDQLKNFARVSVQAADAFEMPAEEVGNFAAKLSTSLGLSEKQIKRVFDLTNSLADAGISDEKDIVAFVDRTGASLKTLGLTMDQTLSLGATALNLGMTSETASTAIDALTNKMLTVNTLGAKNKKTFEKFMGPVGKFSKAVGEDANGALLGMLDTIKELDSNSRMEFLTAFVGQDHASKILRIADAVGELRRNQALAADESKWSDSLGKAYALKLDDFWSQWQLLKNDMNDLNITLGDMGLPAASKGLDSVRAMVREVGHGLENLKANVNMDELVSAKEAVGELVSAVTTVLRMGEKGSAIEGFFDRLSTSANLISGSVNLIKDGLQAVGVVAPDKDTSQDVWDRIKRFGEDYVEWNDGVGRAVKGVNAVNATIDEGEKTYQQDRFRDQTTGRPTDDRADALDAFLGGSLGQSAPIVLPPARLPNEGANALSYTRPTTQQKALATVGVPAPSPALADAPVNLPIPTPRPDILGPVKAEGDAAALAAEAAGLRITEAFSVTATPIINPGSIDAFIAKVRTAKAELNELGAASAAISTMAPGKTGRVDYDGLHADLEP